MADLVHEGSVLVHGIGSEEISDFGLADVRFLDQHLFDLRGAHRARAQLLQSELGGNP